MKKPLRRLDGVTLLAAGALLGAAVQKELSRPPEERTWEGRLGFVPYDLRLPTIHRMRASLWNPEGRVITPQPFGVGWTVNVGRLTRLAQARRARTA